MSHTWVKGAIPGSLRQIVGEARTRPGFALSKIPLASELIAAVLPSKRPPVLVTSLPAPARAGSAVFWVIRKAPSTCASR
jgi:hypothetical protein